MIFGKNTIDTFTGEELGECHNVWMNLICSVELNMMFHIGLKLEYLEIGFNTMAKVYCELKEYTTEDNGEYKDVTKSCSLKLPSPLNLDVYFDKDVYAEAFDSTAVVIFGGVGMFSIHLVSYQFS